MTITVPQIKFA